MAPRFRVGAHVVYYTGFFFVTTGLSMAVAYNWGPSEESKEKLLKVSHRRLCTPCFGRAPNIYDARPSPEHRALRIL
jgi:hypothetical protein